MKMRSESRSTPEDDVVFCWHREGVGTERSGKTRTPVAPCIRQNAD